MRITILKISTTRDEQEGSTWFSAILSLDIAVFWSAAASDIHVGRIGKRPSRLQPELADLRAARCRQATGGITLKANSKANLICRVRAAATHDNRAIASMMTHAFFTNRLCTLDVQA